MTNIDDKVVAMSFDNKKFEEGVKNSISTLDKLKKSLQFQNAGKGLENISRGLGHFQLGAIGSSVDNVGKKLNFLRLTAIGVFSNIATSAVSAGAAMAKSFTVGPIIQGLNIYQTKLQAIQTILANTQAAGTNMGQVTAALDELNRYSNLTIYSFGEMTRNIGTFTAAGVALKPAVSAIKGIANLAALSGSNSQQASMAMYQLSQALSAGRVSLQDWNSVVNAGMGGAVFQRALVQTAVAMGKIKDSSVKLIGPMKNVQVAGQSFRQSIQAGPGKTSWLTSDVLTTALSTFTGDMTDAQLAAKGFTREQIKSIQAQAKMALGAATQVKTFSQLMDVSKETIATGWSTSFELIIGDLKEAKKLWTGVSNVISGIATKSANARNKMLREWKGLGGRDMLIGALTSAFHSLSAIMGSVSAAFRDVFPKTTGLQLALLTDRFKTFIDSLKPSAKTLENLKSTFRGIFAVLDIGRQILIGAAHMFEKLFGVIFSGSGGFLQFTAKIGDFLFQLDLAIRKGGGFTAFFESLGKILAVPLHILGQIGQQIGNLFTGFNPGGFSVNMDFMAKTTDLLHKAVDLLAQAFQGLGTAFGNAMQNINWDSILAVIRTGLFAGIFLMVRKFIGGTTLEKTLGLFGSKMGKGFAKNLAGGVFSKLGPAFGSVTGSLNAMQKKLQAETLQSIAVAIALLAGSLFVLSLIKPDRLNSAMGAMTLAFVELIGAMKLMEKVQMSRRLPLITAGMIGLAIALDLLTIAIYTMSKLSWSELTKGLLGIGVSLGLLVKATESLGKNAPGMIRAGIGVSILAVGLNIMASAVSKFGQMDMKTLGKGLLGVAGALVAISAAMQKMPKSMVMQSVALVVIAEALNLLAGAVKKFGTMNLKVIGKGILAIGVGLAAIAGAMHLMPKGMVLMAAGLFIVAESLDKIVSAVGKMGKMSLKVLATGIGSLAASLLVLALALQGMTGTLAGAVALGITALSLSLLVPALIALGKQSWTSIIKGLVGLGGAMVVIGLAGAAMSASVPALLGFGAALLLIGGGIALVGSGIFLIGLGLSSIAVAGPAAVGILISALINLAKAIPQLVKSVILGVLEIVKMLAKTAPQFVDAVVKIIDSLAEAVIKTSPKLAEAFAVLILSILQAFDAHGPEIIQAGFNIIIDLLQGIRNNIKAVTDMVAEIIINFVNAFAEKVGDIAKAGFNLIIGLVQGVANNITILMAAAGDALIKFLEAFGSNVRKITEKGTEVAVKLINALVKQVVTMVGAVAQGLIDLLNGVASILEQKGPKFVRAMTRIALAIVKTLALTIASMGTVLGTAFAQLGVGAGATFAKNFVTSFFENLPAIGPFVKWLNSWDNGKQFTPSPGKPGKVGPGGFNGPIGKEANDAAVKTSGKKQGKIAARAFVSAMSESLSKTKELDVNPTITPVLNLSKVKKTATQLSGKNGVFASASVDQASVIAAQKTKIEVANETTPSGTTTIHFEQNNNSPKALNEIEIYRMTRNQLSQLKAVTVPI